MENQNNNNSIETVQICTSKRAANTKETLKAALDANPLNLPMNHITRHTDNFTLALVRGRLWKPGTVLKVKFMPPYPIDELRSRIINAAKQWEKYANLKFDIVNDNETADIRIKVTNSGSSWSYVGTDMKMIPQNQHNMEFGWFDHRTNIKEINRTTIHEFGHAIGCIHEHQNPSAGIPWDLDKLYAYYQRTQGWDRATTYHNVVKTYDKNSTNFSQTDPKSIMMYAIPNELTQGDYSVGWNSELSEMDKLFIETVYPFEEEPILDITPTLTEEEIIDAGIKAGGQVDLYQFTLHYPLEEENMIMVETAGNTDVVMSLLNEKQDQVLAYDDDSGEARNARIVYKAKAHTKYYVKVKHYSVQGTGEYQIKLSYMTNGNNPSSS